MRWVLLMPLMIAACPPPEAASDPAREVLKAALAHALIDPGDLPDKGLVDSGHEILVRSAIPNSTAVIATETLTAIPGKTFTLLTTDELQARVSGDQSVYFVQVDGLQVTGDEAELWIGVGIAAPSGHRIDVLLQREGALHARPRRVDVPRQSGTRVRVRDPGRRMRIKLSDERRADLVSGLQSYITKEFEIELSEFQARELLDFFVRHLGPSVYNQAIQDARGFVQEKLTDLEGEFYEPEDPRP